MVSQMDRVVSVVLGIPVQLILGGIIESLPLTSGKVGIQQPFAKRTVEKVLAKEIARFCPGFPHMWTLGAFLVTFEPS